MSVTFITGYKNEENKILTTQLAIKIIKLTICMSLCGFFNATKETAGSGEIRRQPYRTIVRWGHITGKTHVVSRSPDLL